MSRSPWTFWNASNATSVGAVVLVLFFWVTSYYRCRVFSERGRVLVLVVKGASDTDHWLRVSPPAARVWRDLRPGRTARFAGLEFAPPTTVDRYEYTYYNGPTKGAPRPPRSATGCSPCRTGCSPPRRPSS